MSNYRELIMLVRSDQLAAMLSEEKKQNISSTAVFNPIPGKKGIVFWVNRQKYFFTWEQLEKYQQHNNS